MFEKLNKRIQLYKIEEEKMKIYDEQFDMFIGEIIAVKSLIEHAVDEHSLQVAITAYNYCKELINTINSPEDKEVYTELNNYLYSCTKKTLTDKKNKLKSNRKLVSPTKFNAIFSNYQPATYYGIALLLCNVYKQVISNVKRADKSELVHMAKQVAYLHSANDALIDQINSKLTFDLSNELKVEIADMLKNVSDIANNAVLRQYNKIKGQNSWVSIAANVNAGATRE